MAAGGFRPTRLRAYHAPGDPGSSAYRDWFSNDTFDLLSQHSQNATAVNVMNDPAKPGFDAYASKYDAALAEGLSVSGETKDYFAQGRVEHLAGRLRELRFRPEA